MIKTVLIIILVLLYLRAGLAIFYAAIRGFGGKEAYLDSILDEHPRCNVELTYAVAMFLVTISWPYFILVGNIERKKRK